MVKVISEYDIFSCSCYEPYESLMSGKKQLMHSLLLLLPNREEHKEQHCVSASTLSTSSFYPCSVYQWS